MRQRQESERDSRTRKETNINNKKEAGRKAEKHE